ncbi:M20/M25/M40 family metallo-hydrolase [Flavobacteriaceae bacterium R38]|nr:M20/M25/M40 family metallo-hydrolase [Flavobacteriaceae bacterium R38]
MKRSSTILSIFLIAILIYWSYYALMPQSYSKVDTDTRHFSTERALTHVKAISQKEHYVGSKAHKEVRDYIIDQFKSLGLTPSIQEGYTTGEWGNLSKAINILARIEGTEEGKALVLLTHYDSKSHSSFGASDAGSGVATIIEAIRAFLSTGEKPKNDIIILITDAEELGLNGAQLFVNNHPWAKDAGLVLNFEARGSGGPSYMLIETNGGNKELIKMFSDAAPEYPVANSLAYSIYKMLPNDTDLTVFREDGNIQGFNFAFIDDHFDYHTANDNYENLDRNTLEHQGTYIMPLLHYFGNANLSTLEDKDDYIYFNVPLFGLVFYPFSWIVPMLEIAILLFVLLIGYGIKKGKLSFSEIFKGFLPFIISLILCGVIGYFGWGIIKTIYPQYNDILHGFTYNGHSYIAAFVALCIGISFFVYYKFDKLKTVNLIVAPLFFWLIICGGIAFYLKGASFFIIPVFATLVAFYILINQEHPRMILLILLSIPTLWILSPFIQMFPVGLGLNMLVAVTLFTILIFGLMLPVFGFYKKKRRMAYLAFLFALGFFVKAHFQSDFNEQRPKPNSLLYIADNDEEKAQWATYDTHLDNWVDQYIENEKNVSESDAATFSSKYSTRFSFTTAAAYKNIAPPQIELSNDTIIGNERLLEICIKPQRDVNQLDVFNNDEAEILECQINGIPLRKEFLDSPRRRNRLITHYISNNDYTEITLKIPVDNNIEFTFFEASYDLLENSLFSIPKRPENSIPMPFVLNDAIVVKKTFKID